MLKTLKERVSQKVWHSLPSTVAFSFCWCCSCLISFLFFFPDSVMLALGLVLMGQKMSQRAAAMRRWRKEGVSWHSPSLLQVMDGDETFIHHSSHDLMPLPLLTAQNSPALEKLLPQLLQENHDTFKEGRNTRVFRAPHQIWRNKQQQLKHIQAFFELADSNNLNSETMQIWNWRLESKSGVDENWAKNALWDILFWKLELTFWGHSNKCFFSLSSIYFSHTLSHKKSYRETTQQVVFMKHLQQRVMYITQCNQDTATVCYWCI